jgi:hypothetical protein
MIWNELRNLEIGNLVKATYSKGQKVDYTPHNEFDDIFSEIRKYANQITSEAKNKVFQDLLNWTDEPLTAEVRNKIHKHRKSKYKL